MTKGKRAAIYTRVSTNSQTTENQRLELERIAEARGWTVVKVYQDQGISGAKGRDKRPAFDNLMSDATRHRFDVVMAWSIDRIGRSVHAVSGFIAEMESLGVAQYYQQQAIDTSTPSGKAMVHMCMVFAEFERDMIRERIRAGLDRARAQKKKLGRPRIPADKAAAIKRALGAGKGVVSTARKIGVGVLTVQRIKAELAAAS